MSLISSEFDFCFPAIPANGRVVQSPQPTSNPNQTQNQKQLFLQTLLEDEVVGLTSLLLLI
jgi:hypothetical protein